MGEVVALQSMPYSATTLHEIILENTRKGNRIFGVFVRDLPDLPSSDGWYYDVFVIMPGSGWVFASKTYTKTLYRRYMYDGNWAGDWELDPTATTPQELALPLEAGLVARNVMGTSTPAQNVYCKDQFGVVTVTACYRRSDTSDDIENAEIVCTLPHGYRPAESIEREATVVYQGDIHPAAGVLVHPNGDVRVHLEVNVPYRRGKFQFSFSATP